MLESNVNAWSIIEWKEKMYIIYDFNHRLDTVRILEYNLDKDLTLKFGVPAIRDFSQKQMKNPEVLNGLISVDRVRLYSEAILVLKW